MNEDKILYNLIGKNIKAARKKANLTQEQLANKTNYSASFIANIESNTYQSFSLNALYHIANVLNINVSNLLPDKKIIENTNKIIKCNHCEYQLLIPQELIILLTNIKNITNNQLTFTCPKCQKKINY